MLTGILLDYSNSDQEVSLTIVLSIAQFLSSPDISEMLKEKETAIKKGTRDDYENSGT